MSMNHPFISKVHQILSLRRKASTKTHSSLNQPFVKDLCNGMKMFCIRKHKTFIFNSITLAVFPLPLGLCKT